jgi:hypothetical protein
VGLMKENGRAIRNHCSKLKEKEVERWESGNQR